MLLKKEISIGDFDGCPVWHFDPDLEQFSPLISIDTPIGSIDELHFHAKFVSPQGIEFRGSVTGQGDTAIGIWSNGRWYALHKGWKQTSFEQLSALVRDGGIQVDNPSKLLPLKFMTLINREPYVDWSGEFDLG